VPDSSLNQVFILGQTGNQTKTANYTIQSFNETAYTFNSGIALKNLLGVPVAFSLWGSSGLAVLTMNPGDGPAGMLYLIQDSNFVTNARTASPSMSSTHELVQMRWKPVSTADIVRRLSSQRKMKRVK